MLYFKVFKDFTNFIPINETELEKALAAFKFGTAAMFNFGAVERVEAVIPDYSRTMGWNPSHKLNDDDWNEMRKVGIEKKVQKYIADVKEKIEYLIATNQRNLIGQNTNIVLPGRTKEMTYVTATLAEKLKVK
jgi:hypothetical protein